MEDRIGGGGGGQKQTNTQAEKMDFDDMIDGLNK